MQQYSWVVPVLGTTLASAGAQLPDTAGIVSSYVGLGFSVFAAWKKPGISNGVGVLISVAGLHPALSIVSAIITWAQAIAEISSCGTP